VKSLWTSSFAYDVKQNSNYINGQALGFASLGT
jgi:hypothetical protein